MTGLPLTLRRFTRHEYERLVDLGLFQRDPVELIGVSSSSPSHRGATTRPRSAPRTTC